MSCFTVSLKIWIKVNLLNGLIVAVAGIFLEGPLVALFSLLVMIIGILLTSPLLLPVYLLLKTYCRLPYSFGVRTAWLCWMLFLLVGLLYFFPCLLIGDPGLVLDGGMVPFFCATCLAALLAVLITRRSLREMLEEDLIERN